MDALGTETYELLRDAYQVIDGIPDERVNLNKWQTGWNFEPDQSVTCGTIACAGGFLALHPGFRALGLHVDPEDGAPEYMTLLYFSALARLFGITAKESRLLFGARTHDLSDLRTDRQVWLARVRKFLADKARPDNVYAVQA